MSHFVSLWVSVSHNESPCVINMTHCDACWPHDWFLYINVDRLLSSLKIVRFHALKNSDRIVRFHPWDRLLSPRIVCFDSKIVCFDLRIVCFDPKRSSALTKDRLLLLGSSALTHGSSAFDLDRLLWSFWGSSALTLKDRLLSTLLNNSRSSIQTNTHEKITQYKIFMKIGQSMQHVIQLHWNQVIHLNLRN